MPVGPEQWQEVQRLFHAAAKLDPKERDGFLRDACADAAVRAEVESLLGWQEQAQTFIETPAINLAARNLATRLPELSQGQLLDRYKIISRLGSGGMGVVYRAEDTRLGRTVALKFLLEGLRDDAVELERFRAEARMLSALNHPNICAVYDICEAEGHTFIVMEYVAGKRLDKIIGKSGIRTSQALDYAVQIVTGLEKAHALGIVHRDLKPGNVMVTEDDQIKLLDFGVAKLTQPATGATLQRSAMTLTEVGAVVGTAAYMSPEQAEAKTVDGRSDVFAFGAVLYEMITGHRAFNGDSDIATLAEVLRCDPEPPSRVSPAVPAELDRIVSRCLKKVPERRFQTVADLRVALEEIREETAAGKVIAVRTEPVSRWFTPRRLAMALGLLLPILAVFWVLWSRGRNSPIPAEKRIAVLVFKNVGENPANQALCDGLEEEVSNSLTRLEQFHGALVVVPASDVVKERITSARDAGKTLGANLAVTGSVERTAAGAVHVLINLVDTRTVAQLRTESIDARSPELFELQDGVMEKVARMLEFVLKPEAERAVKAANTSVAGAYAEYIKGLGYLRRYDRLENIDEAIQAFRRAVDFDPRYVLAFAGMAEAYFRKYEALKDSHTIDLALEYATHAVELNKELASVHITLGMIQAARGQYEKAEAEYNTALGLDQLNGRAWLELANAYDASGQHDRAKTASRRAIELRSDDWSTLNALGVSHFNNARYTEAEPYFRQVIRLYPDSAKGYNNLGALYLKMGRLSDATAQFFKSIEIEPTAPSWSNLGISYYMAERYEDAIGPSKKATSLTPMNSTLWGNLADAYRWSKTQPDKAPATYRHALDLVGKEINVNSRDARLHAKAANWWAALGDRPNASKEIDEALTLDSADTMVQYRAALVFEQLDQRDRALRAIQAALDGGYDMFEIEHAPPLASLRTDPRFLKLAKVKQH